MLMLYCEEGNYQEVFQIVEQKIMQCPEEEQRLDINYVSIADNGLTPLGMAIKHRHLPIAEYLIDKGANVNAINKVRNPLYSIHL